MNFALHKKGFLDIPGETFNTSYKKAKLVIVPFGFESSVSFGGGTSKGPQAIIEASRQVEGVDEQSGKSPYKKGMTTLKEPKLSRNPKKVLSLLAAITGKIVKDEKFPLIVGGEHSITQGALKGIHSKYKDVTIVQFDAHSDMRKSYSGSTYSHASVIHQSMKNLPVKHVIQIGIRTLGDSDGEQEFRKKNKKKISTFWAWEKLGPKNILKAIPTQNVYITFDIDAFDPSIMPATGTPEPGGLTWWPTLEILKEIFQKRNVVGADVVEFAPIKNYHSCDLLAARLVYKLIGFNFDPASKKS